MGTYFLAGIYGVGKSTIGEKLSTVLDIPFYSAGDLISQVNGELLRIKTRIRIFWPCGFLLV